MSADTYFACLCQMGNSKKYIVILQFRLSPYLYLFKTVNAYTVYSFQKNLATLRKSYFAPDLIYQKATQIESVAFMQAIYFSPII